MNYTDLRANIQDICESQFSDEQLAMFTRQAEQKIYNTVQFPALRKNQTATVTPNNPYLTLPIDFLYCHSLAVVLPSGAYQYLLNKDVNFLREAYPNPNTTGTPKHYALFTDKSVQLAPTPNAQLVTEMHYGYYPESIVTVGSTWLGENFDSALLNGALVEASRFMKAEADVTASYDKLYVQSIALLKQLGDGKLRQDSYRSGQYKSPIS